jgi:hypothetical protein
MAAAEDLEKILENITVSARSEQTTLLQHAFSARQQLPSLGLLNNRDSKQAEDSKHLRLFTISGSLLYKNEVIEMS